VLVPPDEVGFEYVVAIRFSPELFDHCCAGYAHATVFPILEARKKTRRCFEATCLSRKGLSTQYIGIRRTGTCVPIVKKTHRVLQAPHGPVFRILGREGVEPGAIQDAFDEPPPTVKDESPEEDESED